MLEGSKEDILFVPMAKGEIRIKIREWMDGRYRALASHDKGGSFRYNEDKQTAIREVIADIHRLLA